MSNKELELIKVPYSALLKIELPRYANRVIGIVAKHNPEELHITEMHDLLVAEKPRIDVLIDKFGPHPLTETLKELRKMRSLYISAIRFRLKVVIREDKSGEDNNVKLVSDEVGHFLHNLKLSKNEEMFNQKVTQFFAAISQSEELVDALDSLGFITYLEDLERVHSTLQDLIYKRLSSISERPDETTAELKKPVVTAIKNMMKQIEIAPFIHRDLDYTPLYKELNQLATDYRVMINKRVLYNKRKTEKVENGENDVSTETSTTTTQIAQPIVKVFHLNGEEADLNEYENEPIGTKIGAAMSSKTMQLPVVDNNEASEM